MSWSLEEYIQRMQRVAELEGWDTSLQAKHLEVSNSSVLEALNLQYQGAADQIDSYLRIRAKRPNEFWAACKALNETVFPEWRDLKKLSKSLNSRFYPAKSKPKKKKSKDEKTKKGSNQQDSNQEDCK